MRRIGNPPKKKEPKKKEIGMCYDCINAYLMQSAPYNPVVSECAIFKNREVAKAHLCTKNSFERNTSEERIIHPMIKLKTY